MCDSTTFATLGICNIPMRNHLIRPYFWKDHKISLTALRKVNANLYLKAQLQ